MINSILLKSMFVYSSNSKNGSSDFDVLGINQFVFNSYFFLHQGQKYEKLQGFSSMLMFQS